MTLMMAAIHFPADCKKTCGNIFYVLNIGHIMTFENTEVSQIEHFFIEK